MSSSTIALTCQQALMDFEKTLTDRGLMTNKAIEINFKNKDVEIEKFYNDSCT